jgi:hypothetical protein
MNALMAGVQLLSIGATVTCRLTEAGIQFKPENCRTLPLHFLPMFHAITGDPSETKLAELSDQVQERLALATMAEQELLPQLQRDLGAMYDEPPTDDDADAFLAEQCLRCLFGAEYQNADKIGRLLRSNIVGTGDVRSASRDEDGKDGNARTAGFTEAEGMPYEYAARYWAYHLTRVDDPSDVLLSLASTWIQSLQFAHWAEFRISRNAEVGSDEIWLSGAKLRAWQSTLPWGRQQIPINEYVSAAYDYLQGVFERQADDHVLPLLALLRAGILYRNTAGRDEPARLSDAVESHKKASSGLANLLGRRNPLALMARKELGASWLAAGALETAVLIFAELAEEREVIGPDSIEYWEVVFYLGQTQHLMNDYEMAVETLDKAIGRLAALLGTDARRVMMAQLWKDSASAYSGHRELARVSLHRLMTRSLQIYGPEDLTTFRLQLAFGGIERTVGDRSLAVRTLEEASVWWNWMHGEWKMQSPTLLNVDLALQLVAAYWDVGRTGDAKRLCTWLWICHEALADQWIQGLHIQGLFAAEWGGAAQAVSVLNFFGYGPPRFLYSPSMFWLILDLADFTRMAEDESATPTHKDRDPAAELFKDILRSTASNDGEILDGKDSAASPRLLRLAEKALRLLREDKLKELKRLFEQEEVVWVQPEDTWLFRRVPAVDTARLRRPKVGPPRSQVQAETFSYMHQVETL